MAYTPERLDELAATLGTGKETASLTARQLIGWFDSQRRGRRVVADIRRRLKKLRLVTIPDFEYAYIDEPLLVLVDGNDLPNIMTATPTADTPQDPLVAAVAEVDPTYRIGKLPSANTPPTGVNPSATVAEAVTTMLYHDYSQLPVIQGERSLSGAVSWRSIGRRLALGHECSSVQDCREDATVISSETSLFAAIPTIVEKQYVFIQDATKRIVGIVTTTDLSLQFRQLAEPFLLLGEIENQLRRLSDGKFTQSELASVKDPADTSRAISDLSDLTFGEHLRLLEKPERWQALGLSVDRGVFVKHLSEVRDIRNSVMHFDPDGIAPDELERLRRFTRLLAALRG